MAKVFSIGVFMSKAPTISSILEQGSHPAARGDDMDFILAGRDKNAFKRANHHSWLVRLLKILFPILALLLLVTIAGSYYWAQIGSPTLKVEDTVLKDTRIVMKNPELKGFDKENRPYVLNAAEAIQDALNPSTVELSQIDANVPMQDGIYADIIAGTGLYDSKAKTLKLGGEVDVRTITGMFIKLQDADIDMDAGTLFTDSPILMSSPQAKISADALRVEGNGEKVIFNNRVKMTIFPDKIETSTNTISQN